MHGILTNSCVFFTSFIFSGSNCISMFWLKKDDTKFVIKPENEKLTVLEVEIQQTINKLKNKINYLLEVQSNKEALENNFIEISAKLQDVREQNQVYKQRIENQRIELKNLNTKREQVSQLTLRTISLKNEIEQKTHALQHSQDKLRLYATKIENLEQNITEYKDSIEIVKKQSELQSHMKTIDDSSGECIICSHEFTADKKKVAFGPCGHCTVCIGCTKKLKKNARGQQRANCPVCRKDIVSTITLEGIYWN